MQCVLRKSVRHHGTWPTISRKRGRIVGRLLVCFLVLSLVGNHLVPGQNKLPAVADFIDIAQRAGLTSANVFGGKESSRYILESTGTGVAVFDYDNDGWPDILLVNGSTLEGVPLGNVPTNRLYHNNHDGTFTDVTEKTGLVATGWGQGVC